ncbi:hypothetical protein VP1G_11483 [Cytospora mali]|uniref:Uncharacterized protein n=1 Tax=Cytospora mali TaxID=578113 RepID=A0A194VGT8_CYTMA|nr:hypothetical protein VP1G_11483 [Valsa mali var. pyri (nom. inval.)]
MHRASYIKQHEIPGHQQQMRSFQGDGDSTEPGAEEATQQTAKSLVERSPEASHRCPGTWFQTVHVDKREAGQDGQMGGTEEGV